MPPQPAYVATEWLFFLATNSYEVVSDQRWRATGDRVALIKRLRFDGSYGHASQLTVVGDRLFFEVTTELTGPEL